MNSPFFTSSTSSSSDDDGDSESSDPTDVSEPSYDDVPEFGLADMIEAFTAMRHEWRSQALEGRELSSAVVASVEQIQQLENRLQAQLAVATSDSLLSGLVNLIVDIDVSISRAVDACVKYDVEPTGQTPESEAAVRAAFAKQSFVVRRFSRPFLNAVLEILKRNTSSGASVRPETEGLQLVVSRLRRMMAEKEIQRLDVVGQPFDAEIMNAVSAVESTQYPSGHVVEELSPAYRWRGRILRFADVRVSR